ncbi:MAG: ATP-binding protein [Candidatus Helarchaeota archaeon]
MIKLSDKQKIQLNKILKTLIETDNSIFITGASGSGKTTYIYFILENFKNTNKILIRPKRFLDSLKLVYSIIKETLEQNYNFKFETLPKKMDFVLSIEELANEFKNKSNETPIIIFDDFHEIIGLKKTSFLTDFTHLINRGLYRYILALLPEKEEEIYKLHPKLRRRMEMWEHFNIEHS